MRAEASPHEADPDLGDPAPEIPAPENPVQRLESLLRPQRRSGIARWRAGIGRSESSFTGVVDRRWYLVAVVAVVVLGAWWFVGRSPTTTFDAGSLPLAGSSPATTTAALFPPSSVASGAVTVNVSGAVISPGVYTLPDGRRVTDLLAVAGGARPDADLDRLNLAAPLVDGSRVWVPIIGQPEVPAVVPASGAGGGVAPSGSGTTDAPVDLNSATEAELDRLPGVGPSTAAAIVAFRTTHGRFADVDQLTEVRGIGPAKLDALRGSVVVNP